jgi:hypothetical protein
MTVRSVQSGREQSSLQLLSANSFFRRGTSGWPRVSKAEQEAQKAAGVYPTTYAQRLANQLNYSKTTKTFFGYSGVGYGKGTEGDETVCNFRSDTYPIYHIFEPTAPLVKVWFVKEGGAEEELRPEGAFNDMQGAIEAVPMPDPTKILTAITKTEEEEGITTLSAAGTDKVVTIVDHVRDTIYEFHRLRKFVSGPHSGEWKCGYAGVLKEASNSLGVYPVMPSGEAPGDGQPWGISASGLVLPALTITLQDIVDVLRGKPIRHALGISVGVRGGRVAPATKNDSGNLSVPELHEGSPNPAWTASAPYPDEIPEGLAVCFPEGSEPSEHGITAPLASAVYRALRDYGGFVHDGAGSTTFQVEDLRAIGSPCAWARSNPFYGCTSAGPTAADVAAYLAAFYTALPGGWDDKTLPPFTEDFVSSHSIVFNQPWEALEQLQPRSS